MAQIKRLSDEVLITVSEAPQWRAGIWECGDQRFTDPDGTQYEPVVTVTYPLLTPMQYLMSFSETERPAIKYSTDPMVMSMWDDLQHAIAMWNSPNPVMINPNIPSVQRQLAYLATPKTASPPGAGILASMDRVKEISMGQVQ